MKHMMSRIFSAVLVAGFMTIPFASFAQEAEQEAEPEESLTEVEVLQKELAEVQAEIVMVQEEVHVRHRELWQKQHELEYGDEEIARIRREMKDLEAELVEYRKKLDVLIKANPEMLAIDKERREVFQRLRELREKEGIVRKELEGAMRRAGLGE